MVVFPRQTIEGPIDGKTQERTSWGGLTEISRVPSQSCDQCHGMGHESDDSDEEIFEMTWFIVGVQYLKYVYNTTRKDSIELHRHRHQLMRQVPICTRC